MWLFKRILLTLIISIPPLLPIYWAHGYNPVHMAKLIPHFGTGECVGCDLSGAPFGQDRQYNLANDDLRNANMRNADLRGTYLVASRIEGADFRGAFIDKDTNFSFASSDERTQFSPGALSMVPPDKRPTYVAQSWIT